MAGLRDIHECLFICYGVPQNFVCEHGNRDPDNYCDCEYEYRDIIDFRGTSEGFIKELNELRELYNTVVVENIELNSGYAFIEDCNKGFNNLNEYIDYCYYVK